VTSTFSTDLSVNQVDRFCVLGVLASIWQVLAQQYHFTALFTPACVQSVNINSLGKAAGIKGY
jgi:hypothetical protein